MKKLLLAFSTLFLVILNDATAQDYNWTGTADGNFYNVANWTSTSGPVVFDNSSFKAVRTNTVATNAPVINSFINWQPGIFDNIAGALILNANFNVYFNDKLNGTVTVNTGAIFTCRNIFRIGREGAGTVNINGGTFRCQDASNFQSVFIGALSGGNGTANVNSGGLLDGGYQVEVGTRNYYPTGALNINTGGTAQAYWVTTIGPNGTVNLNGGTLNTGQTFLVGDVYVDNAGTEGTLGAIVGKLNVNSGTVIVNQNDLANPVFSLHAKAKVTINGGSLVIKRTGRNFTPDINTYISGGQIVAAAGKRLVVTYDGTALTTVTAIISLPVSLVDFTANAQNQSVIVKWSTASEQNNSYFNLAHSTDGINFSVLSKINAAANGNAINNYAITDVTPANGINYYQLQQVDMDGKSKYLGIKSINMGVITSKVSVYPNPTKAIATVSFERHVFTNAKLIDFKGTILATKKIANTATLIDFDMTMLNAGNYVIQLVGEATKNLKIIKE